jgi:uncharacterized membrane protein HdeD (DUF308 family)
MIAMAYIEENVSRWWIHLILGTWSVALAVAALLWPGLTLVVTVILVAAYAFINGVLEIMLALRLRRLKRHLVGAAKRPLPIGGDDELASPLYTLADG